jgi:DNA-binding PadR family transcriptional regulator
VDGISYKVLTDTLRRAERDGLITRHLDPGRVETATLYKLTDLGDPEHRKRPDLVELGTIGMAGGTPETMSRPHERIEDAVAP